MSAAHHKPSSHGPELRSVARSIEPLFPNAADLLRGIARELDAAGDVEDGGADA